MNKKLIFRVLLVCIFLILVLVFVYSGLRILESTVLFHEQEQEQIVSKTIVEDGIAYYPRQDLSVVLLMGINQTGKVKPTEYNRGGAVDMLTLMVFDKKTKTCNLLSLNRDMMVSMPALNMEGRAVGTYYGQLAYSHTYGDGMKDSCENVRKTVSKLLNGIPIDYYFALNLDAIALFNDAVGGVTVTVEDDFSAVTPELPMGQQVHLTGEQAVTFVQTRWDVGDELNLSRMERHKAYIHGFVEKMKDCMESDAGFVIDTYETVSDYIVTDCTPAILSRLVTDYGEYTLGKSLAVEGENVLGEEYYEFYADEEKLKDLVLALFYAPK